jgi:hypothetical protein
MYTPLNENEIEEIVRLQTAGIAAMMKDNGVTLSISEQAIKHIANNWFGKLNIKYVMTFTNNDDTIINNIDTLNLNNTDYFEYSISIEKTFYNTNVHATVGHQDGDIYGWFGNINIKYLF